MAAATSTPTFHVTAVLPIGGLMATSRGTGIPLTLLLARAAALVVEEEPLFNAAFTPEGLAFRARVDVGIAVDTEDGLLTPVLRDAAACPLTDLHQTWTELRDRARRRRLPPADYRGATFYLSNLGMYAIVRRFDAILPLGATSILAVGAAIDAQAEFTLTCDHRVVFGAHAARFLTALARRLEEPAPWAR